MAAKAKLTNWAYADSVCAQRLLDWHAEGALKPHISHRLPLDRLPKGLDLLRSRAATGKVVIDYRPVHDYTMTNDIAPIPPKTRVY